MPKIMQNLVFLMEPSHDAHRMDIKAGNMYLNRFRIDEDAAFEISGVHYLEKSSDDIAHGYTTCMELKRKSKSKGVLIT